MSVRSRTRAVVIAGVRPQFIKVAALQRAIDNHNRTADVSIDCFFINSGQHYDDEVAGAFIRELNIRFDYTLIHPDRTPIRILANMIVGLYEILDGLTTPPAWVAVIGDATTTLAGALASARKRYPIVHIEAGVRSGDLTSAEEMHRRVVSHLASVHICSTQSGVANLRLENIMKNVFWTGDLSYEFFVDYARAQPIGYERLPVGQYILATLHKSVNLDSDDILRALVYSLAEYPREVLFVTHPHCRQRLSELDLLSTRGITFVDSLPYGIMLSAIKGCAFLVTDSGGLQREAYYLGKRCLVRRDKHGWSELVDRSIHLRLGTDRPSMIEGLEKMEGLLAAGDYGDFVKFQKEGATAEILQFLAHYRGD
jgi:UDP-GlcNAc3NAcA epimerase